MKPHRSWVVAFGAWLSAATPFAQAQQVEINAATGAVAIGGNVSHSTINMTGLSWAQVDELVRQRTRPLEELKDQQRETIALLKDRLDLDVRHLRRALEIVGEADVPPERLPDKLVEIAERYKALLAGSTVQPGDSANVAALKAGAQKAIDAGDLDQADALLANVEADQ